MKKQSAFWKGKVIFDHKERVVETEAKTVEEFLLSLGKNPIEYVAVIDGKVRPLRSKLDGHVIRFYHVGSRG